MPAHKQLSPRIIERLLSYDADSGEVRYRARPNWLFSKSNTSRAAVAASWNKKWAGEVASISGPNGYRRVQIFSKRYALHRVCWVLAHGHWPRGGIDHINGNRADNRLANLRDVPQSENAKNRRPNRNNTSGHIGVYYRPDRDFWVAGIGVNKKHVHLGVFATKQEAIAARKAAEINFEFHPNHGETPCSH